MCDVPRRIRRSRLLVVLLVGLWCVLIAAGQPAKAEALSRGTPTSISRTIAAWSGNRHVAFHRLTPRQAIEIAAQSAQVRSWWAVHPALRPAALPSRSGGQSGWEVSWWAGETVSMIASLSERSDRVTTVWTGPQAQWTMARGYAWYSGNVLGRWYVWIPLCLLFMAPFVDRKRPFRLLHFDLLALLALSFSFFLFASGHISGSVPLLYPVLCYLLVRVLWAAFRPGTRPERLIPHFRPGWLVAGIVVLTLVRIALNLTDSTVLDVGAASAAGAHQVLHGQALYDGSLGRIILAGDTYGPVTYLAYVPFAALFPHDHPWLGHGVASVYSHHPSVQTAAIFFDLLTLVGLILLGRRLRAGSEGKVLGLAFGYSWVSYPFSALALQENTNDSLVAALVVLMLLFLYAPARRGVMLALATFAKFFPVILVPLIATGPGPRRMKPWVIFAAGFAIAACVVLLPFVPLAGLRDFYHHTIGAQIRRSTPFSIWGQHSSLHPLQLAAEGATVLLALVVSFVPRVRSDAQVAALAAALVIAFEMCLGYWYYSYVVWFAPLAFVALFLPYRLASSRPMRETEAVSAEPLSLPVPEPVA